MRLDGELIRKSVNLQVLTLMSICLKRQHYAEYVSIHNYNFYIHNIFISEFLTVEQSFFVVFLSDKPALKNSF